MTRAANGDGSRLVGRFENMDTLVGMFQDPLEDTDVAICMGKITDTQSRISWDQQVYKDPREAAAITVVDPDENLDCNRIEYVPVFVIVNPGSWNPVNSDISRPDDRRQPDQLLPAQAHGGIAGNERDALED